MVVYLTGLNSQKNRNVFNSHSTNMINMIPITLRISRLYGTEQKMNELTKRDVKKGELAYLDDIQDIHNKHMELLFDLMQHPKLGKNIPDITERKDVLLNSKLFHTELEPPFKKPREPPEEITD